MMFERSDPKKKKRKCSTKCAEEVGTGRRAPPGQQARWRAVARAPVRLLPLGVTRACTSLLYVTSGFSSRGGGGIQ